MSLHQSAPHEVVEKYELASLSIVENQIFTQPRPKRCATHCYIAWNIHYLQQFMKINPFLPPASRSNACISAATLVAAQCVKPAEAIGAKLEHLIVAANINSHGDMLNLSIVASIVLQNESTVDLFAAEIQIHKQPLDAADYILIGIHM
ncbi:time for coffee-like protein isoform X1 [Tanacetum coccineum]